MGISHRKISHFSNSVLCRFELEEFHEGNTDTDTVHKFRTAYKTYFTGVGVASIRLS